MKTVSALTPELASWIRSGFRSLVEYRGNEVWASDDRFRDLEYKGTIQEWADKYRVACQKAGYFSA